MQKTVLWRLADSLREVPVHEAGVLALQFLSWVKLSLNRVLPEELSLQQDTYPKTARLFEIWQKIAEGEGGVDDAIAKAFKVKTGGKYWLQDETVTSALKFAEEANKSGHLSKIVALDDPNYGIPCLEFGLPSEVAHLVVSLASIEQGWEVYCPFDAECQLASRVAKSGAKAIVETPTESPIPWLTNILLDVQIEVSISDPIHRPVYRNESTLQKFDATLALLSFPERFDKRLSEEDAFQRFVVPSSSGVVLSLQHLMAQSARKVVAVVPPSLLFSTGTEQRLRKYIVSGKWLQSVLSLPTNLFSHTSASFSILTLDLNKQHKSVRFVAGENEFNEFSNVEKKNRSKLTAWKDLHKLVYSEVNGPFSKTINISEILDKDSVLQVSRYVASKSTRKLEQFLSEHKTVNLKDYFTFLRPLYLSENQEGVKVFEVTSGDLPSYGYVLKPSKTAWVDDSEYRKRKEQFLHPLDVLIVIKGAVGKVGIIPETVPAPGPDGWIPNQSCIVVRAKSKDLEPRVLASYLRSPVGQAALKTLSTSGNMPFLQFKDLQNLLVPVMNSEYQERVLDAFEEQARLQNEIRELEEKQENIRCQFWPLDDE